jgi:hypothetical protein
MKLRSWRGVNRSIGSARPILRLRAGALCVLVGSRLLDVRLEAQSVVLPVIRVQPRCLFVPPAHSASFSVLATNPAWVQVPVSSGDWSGSTNIVMTGQDFGTMEVDYSFYNIPDTLRVYYDDVRIFDSGLVSGSGTFWINYGPGKSTTLTIVIDEGGNPSPDTLWNYQASFSIGLTYQWQKDGVQLPAGTNATYFIPSAELPDAGLYSVIVSNQFGTVTSDSALLSLEPALQLRIVLTPTNTVVLAWPAPSASFVLQQTDTVDLGNWETVPDTPVVVGS